MGARGAGEGGEGGRGRGWGLEGDYGEKRCYLKKNWRN